MKRFTRRPCREIKLLYCQVYQKKYLDQKVERVDIKSPKKELVFVCMCVLECVGGDVRQKQKQTENTLLQIIQFFLSRNDDFK